MFYLLLVVCWLYVLWRMWYKRRSTTEPPELSGRLPIVGHGMTLRNRKNMSDSIKRACEECLEKGGVVTIYLGPFKAYGVTDPEACFSIMNTCLKKHYVFDFAKPFIGNGLSTADVPLWKIHRKLLNPAFSQQVLDGYIEIFNTKAKSLVDQFASELGNPFNHENLLRMSNLETICSTSLGIDSSEYSDLLTEYLPRFAKLIEYVNKRTQKFWLHSNFIYNMTRHKKNLDEETKRFIKLSTSIIQNKKSERERQTSTVTKPGATSFLDRILDLADDTGCFTDEEVREHTDNIIAAGHETTATLMVFVLAMLGSHTDVQDQAYKEVLHILGNSDRYIEKDDLHKLVYIEAVLKETLRLFPIFPILARRIDKDVKIENYTMKANSDCFLLIYGLHRDKIWGPDADQFRPERWLNKETIPDSKYFAGFGTGRRFCIGKAYALMSMKITVAHVLRKYRISSDASKMVVNLQVMAKPASGHFITLALRNT